MSRLATAAVTGFERFLGRSESGSAAPVLERFLGLFGWTKAKTPSPAMAPAFETALAPVFEMDDELYMRIIEDR